METASQDCPWVELAFLGINLMTKLPVVTLPLCVTSRDNASDLLTSLIECRSLPSNNIQADNGFRGEFRLIADDFRQLWIHRATRSVSQGLHYVSALNEEHVQFLSTKWNLMPSKSTSSPSLRTSASLLGSDALLSWQWRGFSRLLLEDNLG